MADEGKRKKKFFLLILNYSLCFGLILFFFLLFRVVCMWWCNVVDIDSQHWKRIQFYKKKENKSHIFSHRMAHFLWLLNQCISIVHSDRTWFDKSYIYIFFCLFVTPGVSRRSQLADKIFNLFIIYWKDTEHLNSFRMNVKFMWQLKFHKAKSFANGKTLYFAEVSN